MTKKYWKILVLLSLPVQLLFIQIIADKSVWIERVYTFGFYQELSEALRRLFGNIPFPVGQLIFYGIVAFLTYWLLRQVRKLLKKQIRFGLFIRYVGYRAVAFLSGFYFLFTLMWGLNYHRRPMQDIAQLNTNEFSVTELEQLCQRLIQLTNEGRKQLTQNEQQALAPALTHEQILERATKGYAKAATIYPELHYTLPAVKSVFVPELMSFFGIGGIYFPFTGEANVNMDPPAFLLPETVCHEMAHQIGVASEDEANYVAYLVCNLNEDPFFGYSANYTAMKYAMNRLHFMDQASFERLEQTISPGVKKDLEENKKYWESFQNPIEVVAEVIHDLFLKANDQEEGVRSYSRVVELLMGEYRKNGLVYSRLAA